MTSIFTELAIDCSDPDALARFWCAALDYEQLYADAEIVTIGPPETARETHQQADQTTGPRTHGPGAPTLTFARVPEPKTTKNRVHLDLSPGEADQAAEVRRLLALGARRVDVGQGEQSWVVLADPEGNEFCVLAARHACK